MEGSAGGNGVVGDVFNDGMPEKFTCYVQMKLPWSIACRDVSRGDTSEGEI